MTHPVNSRQIEVFRTVMLCGTTTGAAKLLHTSQPAISRTLSQFQWACGLKLFEIQRSKLLPTAEAKELFDSVQRHFLGLEKVEGTIAALRHTGVGLLRIACTPVLALTVIPSVVQRFKLDFPSVRISVQTIGTHLMRDGLLSGMYDLALSTSDIGATGLEPMVVHQTRPVCVMQKDHPLASRSTVHVRDLKHFPLLAHHTDDALQQLLQEVMSKHEVVPPSVVETNYSSTICAMAAAGVGVGVVSPYAVSIFSNVIHVAPFSPGIIVRTQLAYSPITAPSQITTAFVDRLRTYLNEWKP
jgi:DNA-binding transcriptional LysR family regulator